MPNERFNPVAHDDAFVAQALADAETRQAYDGLEEEYAALQAVLRARHEAGLTQAEIARRMGTTTSAVSRLEASLVSQKHSPSFATLKKYAHACGKKLVVSLA
ncbi:MAG: helix-turn-helix domain-containing protein [Gallionella sp.]|nr:helix-turn-helix domain-containing protein [Gallionella sp.]MDD4945828.1 helix-turn-helix domain-containing protein [Gallionella sp.]